MPDSHPSPSADDRRLFTLLFVAWCFVAGTLLMYAPWMPVWMRWVSVVDSPWLHELLVHPTFRGAVSGFGLFHLVWGTHDLDQLLARFLKRRLSDGPEDGPVNDGAGDEDPANETQ